MQKDLRALVFDMDGLMIDTEPIYKVAWQAASAQLGYPIDDALYATFVGRPTPACEEDLVATFGSAFPLEQFRVLWPSLWRAEATASGIQRKPGVLECLDFAKAQGLPVAVATSSDADYAAFSLRRAGLDGRFGIMVTGEQVARGKPAPDIYLEAARRLQVDPAACVALEDSEAGVLAASRAGMRTLLIPDGVAPTETAVRAAFRVFESLHEARGLIADLLASRPGE
jgi:HAD superfamily hydrolase (TIGR01509 family)